MFIQVNLKTSAATSQQGKESGWQDCPKQSGSHCGWDEQGSRGTQGEQAEGRQERCARVLCVSPGGGRIHGDFLPGAWLQHRRLPSSMQKVLDNKCTPCRSSDGPPLPAREPSNCNGVEARKEAESGLVESWVKFTCRQWGPWSL